MLKELNKLHQELHKADKEKNFDKTLRLLLDIMKVEEQMKLERPKVKVDFEFGRLTHTVTLDQVEGETPDNTITRAAAVLFESRLLLNHNKMTQVQIRA